MKIGIMQPYFVPYIGYWQLMNAVDKYVVYDDVNFIKGGWVNRNRILINGQPQYFNIPMLGASPHKLINEVQVNNDVKMLNKNLRVIESAYKKAPYYSEVYPIIKNILQSGKENIAEYIFVSFEQICSYLDITTDLIFSSSIKKESGLKGQDKVLYICKLFGATEYFNAIGGKELYTFSEFKHEGIELSFLKTNEIRYPQFGEEFQKNLSIIDVMMFNPKETVRQMLNEYTLVTEKKEDYYEESNCVWC